VSQYEKVYLLNFGARLCEEATEEIRKEVNADSIEQILKKVNLDLSKNPYIQCHDGIISQKSILLGKYPVVINLPGLPIACVFLINEISAITGKEPTIVFTSRDISENGYFSDFKFKRLFNLQYEKTVTREKHKNSEDKD
jgi:hypothetical protein